MLHDEMVCDRIVVGIIDSSLLEKLQLDAELTLITAIVKVPQAEEVKKQQTLLRGETPAAGGKKLDIPVGVVQRGRHSGRLNKKPKSAPHSLNSQPTTCTRCGRTPLHDRRLCPASDAICHKCSKRGHFQVVCHSTVKVGEVHQEDPNEFLGVVDTRDTVSNMWRLSLLLNGVHTEFDIDTGAEVSTISESQHQRIGSLLLSPPGKRLRGPSNYSLPVTGCFTGVLKHGSQKCSRKSMV